MARTIRLRPWQKEALERFRTKTEGVVPEGGADFLAVATPGSSASSATRSRR